MGIEERLAKLHKDGAKVRVIAEALHDDEIEVREAALAALRSMDDSLMPAALDALFLPRMGSQLVAALRAQPAAILDITATLRTAYSEVTYAVMHAFSRLVDADEPYLIALESPNLAVRRAAAQTLGERRCAAAVKPLIDALRAEPSAWGQHAIIEALGVLGDQQAVRPLLRHFRRGDAMLRGTIAMALGRIGDERAIEPLVAAITVWGMGYSIAVALAHFEERCVVPITAVLMDAEAGAQQHLIFALGRTGSQRAVDALLAAANALDDLEVRRAVGRALGELGDGRAAPLLLTWLAAPESALRLGAAEAFQKLDDDRARAPLQSLLDDEDPAVVEAARLALQSI